MTGSLAVQAFGEKGNMMFYGGFLEDMMFKLSKTQRRDGKQCVERREKVLADASV